MSLFDPRKTRAPATQSMTSKQPTGSTPHASSGRSSDSRRAQCPPVIALSTAEAEAVSGTHLYAYLQEVF